MKRIKFFTLGCKINQYETQMMRERLMKAGFTELEDGEHTDFYVINTCTVTHRADSESFNFMRRAKRENPQAKIIVTGCLAELDEKRIQKINHNALIIKNKDKEIISNYLLSRPETTSQRDNESTRCGISYFKNHTRAFLKIQDGCNNRCSYCKVPLVRGSSRSRPLKEIIQEARQLINNDYKELVLSGICLGSYGEDLKPRQKLLNLIEALEDLKGLLRLRLSSIEAGEIRDGLIDKMLHSQKLCRHLHIPMQSGDDTILKRMQRNYTRADYINLIKKIRAKIPLIAITTDILVGFPGENKENFQNTLNLLKEILPLKVHIFPYSRREGTAASGYNQAVSPKIVKERISRLRYIANDYALEYKKRFLNKTMDVLIEGRAKNKADYWEGYTDNYLKILVKSRLDLKNKFITLKLKKIVKDYILGEEVGLWEKKKNSDQRLLE